MKQFVLMLVPVFLLEVATLFIEDTKFSFHKGEPYLEPFAGIPYELILTNLSGSIFEDSLSHLPNCRKLEIYDSVLYEIEDGGLCSGHLRELCMENNVLPSFSGGIFKNCSQLETLDLRDNNFTLNEDAFTNLGNLRELILVDEHITIISKKLFQNLAKLDSLKLYLNGLSVIETGALDNLQQLNSLILSGSSRLRNIDGIFLKLSKLEKLKLAYNRLESFPWNDLRAVPRLSYLDIEGNEVKEIQSEVIIKYLINLRYFNIRNNSVSCKDYFEVGAVIKRGLKMEVKIDKRCENGTKQSL